MPSTLQALGSIPPPFSPRSTQSVAIFNHQAPTKTQPLVPTSSQNQGHCSFEGHKRHTPSSPSPRTSTEPHSPAISVTCALESPSGWRPHFPRLPSASPAATSHRGSVPSTRAAAQAVSTVGTYGLECSPGDQGLGAGGREGPSLWGWEAPEN